MKPENNLNIKELLISHSNQVFEEYGLVISCLVIGIVVGWYLKAFLVDRKHLRQLNFRLDERDLHIAQLNMLIHSRLKNVVVAEKDQGFFKDLKKYFKKQFKFKRK